MFAGINHGAMVLHQRLSRRDFYWIIGAVSVFVCYALNFLYFFVDDEGIPLVYAQNLLRGELLGVDRSQDQAEIVSRDRNRACTSNRKQR